MSRHTLARVAFALVVIGALLAVVRAEWHSQWDAVEQVTFEPAQIEAEQVGAAAVVLGLIETASPAQDVLVRLCAPDSLTEVARDAVALRLSDPARPESAEAVSIWREGPMETPEMGPRPPDACLLFHARGEMGGGRLELTWERGAFAHQGAVEIEAGTALRHPLGWPDRLVVLFMLAGLAFLLVAGQRTRRLDEAPWTPRHMFTVLAVFLLASVLAASLGAGRVMALVGGLVSFGAYVSACWLMAHRVVPQDALGALAFHRVSPLATGLSAAVGLGLAMVVSVLLLLLPQGESPMTQVLQTSGGLVSIMALALISPWSEELLLRGVVYGALERWGGALAAVVGSAAIFSILHLGQHWGNLSPWLMLTATGLALSLVRWRTGSTLASTVAHLTYNLSLALPVLLAG